jgi:hypothetical protein
MSYDLLDPRGATLADAEVVTSGSTWLSDPIPVPSGAGAVSFEILATPAVAPATCAVKVRSGNTSAALLADRGVTSPAELVAFSATTRAFLSVAADSRWIQLEIAVTTHDITLDVVAAAAGASPGVASSTSVSGTVSSVEAAGALLTAAQTVAGAVSAAKMLVTETSASAIKTAVEALSAIVSGGRLLTTEASGASIKTAVEALSAIISGGRLLTTAQIAASQTVGLAAGVASIGTVILGAGSAAIGKLTANSGVIIGAVELAASQTVALAAGTAAFGKLSANTAATYIGDVILQAGTAAIGKLTANDGVDIGDVTINGFPAAAPFTDASANSTTGAGAALASHSFLYEFVIHNTHASQIIYVGDVNVSATRYERAIYPLTSERFAGAGNTNTTYHMASGASTTYLLAGR